MEIKYLNTFLVVARELSFSKASDVLNYAQSSVTAHIQSLENELGVQLFERLGKKVVLTEEGHRLLSYAEKITELVEEAKDEVPGSSAPGGVLVIGAHESQCAYRLPPILREFRTRYPKVRLVFRPIISDRNLHELLRQGSIDAAFMLDIPVTPTGLAVERLINENIMVLAHPEHRLARLDKVLPQEMNKETILTTEEGCAYRRLFEQALGDAGVRPAAKIEFSSIESIKQCVIAGLGIAVLPEMTVSRELAAGEITALHWSGPAFPVMTMIAWHKDKRITPTLEAFLDTTRRTLLSQIKPSF